MLRFAFWILLGLNLLAAAALSGRLGEWGTPGEPWRLTEQLFPERIRIVRDNVPVEQAAAPAPEVPPAPVPTPQTSEPVEVPAAKPAPEPVTVTPPPAPPSPHPEPPARKEAVRAELCAQFSGLSTEQLRNLTAVVRAREPSARIEDEVTATGRDWWVHVPPGGTRVEAEQKVAEMRLAGVKDLFVVREAGPNQNAISLGVFKTEEAARRLQSELMGRGIKGVRIAQRGGSVHRVELRAPIDAMPGLLSALSRLDPAWRSQRCTPGGGR